MRHKNTAAKMPSANGDAQISAIAVANQMSLESSPVDPATLVWAEYWYPIAWKGLIVAGIITAVGACATIAFLLLQWRTTNIRDDQTEWRTSSLELQTATAKADLGKSNERIAELNKDTARLSSEAEAARASIAGANERAAKAEERAAEAQLALAKFRAPRAIPPTEAQRLVTDLSKFAGTNVAIYILGEGPEPNGLAGMISILLKRANWTPLSWVWSGAGAATGIIISTQPGTNAETDPAADALVAALASINLDVGQQKWPGEWDKFGGMLNGPNPPAPTEAPIRIIVGTKP